MTVIPDPTRPPSRMGAQPSRATRSLRRPCPARLPSTSAGSELTFVHWPVRPEASRSCTRPGPVPTSPPMK